PTWRTLLPIPNGTSDLTQALTQAFNIAKPDCIQATAQTKGADVLYIPPGQYTVSQTIRVIDPYGITIIGDDPATTIITWTGPKGLDMFQVIDGGYMKISRLTIDGGATAKERGAAAAI